MAQDLLKEAVAKDAVFAALEKSGVKLDRCKLHEVLTETASETTHVSRSVVTLYVSGTGVWPSNAQWRRWTRIAWDGSRQFLG